MTNAKKLIRSHRDLEVYKMGFEAAMTIFNFSKSFPSEERYSLTDQVRRSSRSVCANLAEAWRRRSYEGNFLLRLNDAEAEAAETQTWLEFAVKSSYLKPDEARDLYKTYERIISMLVKMRQNPKPWLFP
jgi:four helix bundle protein